MPLAEGTHQDRDSEGVLLSGRGLIQHYSRLMPTSYHWHKTSKGQFKVGDPVTATRISEHLYGGIGLGQAPIHPGTAETQVATFDLDSHKGETPFERMQEVAQQIVREAAARGIRLNAYRSSGGAGIHLITTWETPQDAYSVREVLVEVLRACKLKEGASGGVASGVAEIFPKQSKVDIDEFGSMFVLPLYNKSVPLHPETLKPLEKSAEVLITPSLPVTVRVNTEEMKRSAATVTVETEELRRALPFIDPGGMDYDQWRNIVFGIHSATCGSDEGLAIAQEWSARSPKHDPDFLASQVWPYVKEREGGITFATIQAKAREGGYVEDVTNQFDILPDEDEEPPPAKPLVLFDVVATRAGDFYTTEPPAPKAIVRGLFPVDAGTEAAIGGVGKTTRHQYEAAHLILGMPLYGYHVERRGAVLMVTNEDDRPTALWRMHHIAKGLELSEADRRRVGENFYILDLSGTGERLIKADRSGNLERTDLADRIVKTYKGCGVVMVEFDPLNLFGPGERYVNDGEAAVLDLGRYISRELKCCVRFTTHVSKMVGREGIVDAHSGRGGSALGDNARFVHNYLAHDKEHKDHKPPTSAAVAHEAGNLYRLHVSKISSAERPREPIWIERQGFRFIHHTGPVETREERRERDKARVLEFLRDGLEENKRYSQNELETAFSLEDPKLTRDQVRTAVFELKASRDILDFDLPPEERRGARKTYLAPKPIDLGVTK